MAVYYNIEGLIAQKRIREKRKITYRDIAAEADVSTSTLSKMANQTMAQIGLVTIDKLCKYFECSPGDLFVYVNEAQANP